VGVLRWWGGEVKSFDERKLTIKLQTLTPLWTGAADRSCESLKLTGLLGSLRWWFEVLVRGMEYYACDSTSENKCKNEIKHPEDLYRFPNQVCPACFLFGATGWRKRFTVTLNSSFIRPYSDKIKVKIGEKSKEWHYYPGLIGTATLTFYFKSYEPFNEYLKSTLKILLTLIQNYGMLGAKTALGYGVVSFIDLYSSNLQDDWNKFNSFLNCFKNFKHKNNDKVIPTLNDMFFAKFKITNNDIATSLNKIEKFFETDTQSDLNALKNSNWIFISPFVRKKIRKIFNKKEERHFLMGKVSRDYTTFSAIQVSHGYINPESEDLEFKINGWLPEEIPYKRQRIDRDNALEHLSQAFLNPPWNMYIPSEIKQWGTWKNNELSLVNNNINKLLVGETEKNEL